MPEVRGALAVWTGKTTSLFDVIYRLVFKSSRAGMVGLGHWVGVPAFEVILLNYP